MRLSDIYMVLCRPAESGNIGAVCRAMKNMGLSSLRIVSPETEIDEDVLRIRAIHAADIWDKAEHFLTLKDAVADCSLVVGTTRRRGKKRKNITVTPGELAQILKPKPGKAAVVFGNERTGLDSDELAQCTIASHIPVSEAFPSLNLSHAVQIYAYELFCALERGQGGRWVPLDTEKLCMLASDMADALQSIGFYKQAGRDDQERFFRDIMARAGLSLDESRYLRKIFDKIGRLGRPLDKADEEAHT